MVLLVLIFLNLIRTIPRQLCELVTIFIDYIEPCFRARNSTVFNLIRPAGTWCVLMASLNWSQVIVSGFSCAKQYASHQS